jgi:hypothetical protein
MRVGRDEVTRGTDWLPIPLPRHEAATLPTTEAWIRADYRDRHRHRRGRDRLLWRFGLAVLFRLTPSSQAKYRDILSEALPAL